MIGRPPRSTRTDTLFPYATLFRSRMRAVSGNEVDDRCLVLEIAGEIDPALIGFQPGVVVRHLIEFAASGVQRGNAGVAAAGEVRSEEHTSELQSLMRISYAVFCLKKKNTHYETLDTT